MKNKSKNSSKDNYVLKTELFKEDDLVIHSAYAKFIFSVFGLFLVGIGCALFLDTFLGQGIGFIVIGLFFYLVTLLFEVFKHYFKN